MPPIRRGKRNVVPRSRHHPSQSSIVVPVRIKALVKAREGNQCWLCDCRAHRTRRPLEICHSYPQARSRRFYFNQRHISGATLLDNIHDATNLIALCEICHGAFDNDEWIFIPEATTDWQQNIERTPEMLQQYICRRDVNYRRLLLSPDPDSKAYQDEKYRSAFSNMPLKIWAGEPGVLMTRTLPPYPDQPADLVDAFETFASLQQVWFKNSVPCSREICLICRGAGREEDKPEEEEYEQQEEEEEEKEEMTDKESEKGGERNERASTEKTRNTGNEKTGQRKKRKEGEYEGKDSDEGNEEEEEEDDDVIQDDNDENESSEVDEDTDQEEGEDTSDDEDELEGETEVGSRDEDDEQASGSGSKSLKKGRKRRREHSDDEKSRRRRGWENSAPYDESVPYSHRWGYTWANTTSNDLMKMWQVSRQMVVNTSTEGP